jgi:metallo-beta-lactamase class B
MAIVPVVMVAASMWAWGVPPPPVEPIEVKGGLETYTVRHFVSRRMNDVSFCYEHALAANPTLTGRIVVKFTIGAPGEVVASAVQSSTMANPAVEACVAAVVRTFGFPYPRPAGPVTVTYPFAFTPWRATPTAPGVEIEALRDHVFLHRSTEPNGIASNGLIIDTRGGLVLIDTAWTEAQTEVLLRYGDSVLRQEWIGAVITHDHDDRAGGLGALFRRGIPVAAVDLTVAKLEKRGVRGVTTLFPAAAGAFKHDRGGFEAFYPGPGHAPDNIVVKIDDLVFGGCLIKSIAARDLGFTGDAHLAAWPAAVRRVSERYGKTTVVPGHGPVDPTGGVYEHTLKLLAAPKR